MSVSGPTDENVTGFAADRDDGDPTPDLDDAHPDASLDTPPSDQPDDPLKDAAAAHAALATLTAPAPTEPTEPAAPVPADAPAAAETEGTGTRPCAYCGRPVPQRGDSSPPVRYCLDNDGACANAAAER